MNTVQLCITVTNRDISSEDSRTKQIYIYIYILPAFQAKHPHHRTQTTKHHVCHPTPLSRRPPTHTDGLQKRETCHELHSYVRRLRLQGLQRGRLQRYGYVRRLRLQGLQRGRLQRCGGAGGPPRARSSVAEERSPAAAAPLGHVARAGCRAAGDRLGPLGAGTEAAFPAERAAA